MQWYTLETDGRTDVPIQCFQQGGASTGGLQATDIITAKLRPFQSTAVLCQPTMGWYTADNTQNGYQQQQVEAAISLANAALLQDSVRYVLTVYRAPVGDATNVDIAAKIFFVAKGPSQPD